MMAFETFVGIGIGVIIALLIEARRLTLLGPRLLLILLVGNALHRIG